MSAMISCIGFIEFMCANIRIIPLTAVTAKEAVSISETVFLIYPHCLSALDISQVPRLISFFMTAMHNRSHKNDYTKRSGTDQYQ